MAHLTIIYIKYEMSGEALPLRAVYIKYDQYVNVGPSLISLF